MKSILIPVIDTLNSIKLEEAIEIIENDGQKASIDVLNWKKEYPYKPITYFSIARSTESIFIVFNVRGTMLRAIYDTDQQPVYEDSCVEFFCKTIDSEYYTNFEFNCIGTCLATRRKARNESVEPFTNVQMKTIKRLSSLGRRTFHEVEGLFEWQLMVEIPFTLIGIDPQNLPQKILGNFYKCADGTNSMHYVTWNPVNTPTPDFHQPDFFGELWLK